MELFFAQARDTTVVLLFFGRESDETHIVLLVVADVLAPRDPLTLPVEHRVEGADHHARVHARVVAVPHQRVHKGDQLQREMNPK